MPDTALRTLLAGSIDYAGLFPPAGLDMATSVRQYAEYRSHPDAWALGRFVVPAARLGELEQEAARFAPMVTPVTGAQPESADQPVSEASGASAARLPGPAAKSAPAHGREGELADDAIPLAGRAQLQLTRDWPSPVAGRANRWHLSVLLGADAPKELKALGEFNRRHAAPGASALSGDVVEVRADSVDAIDRLLAAVPRWAQAYIEIPLDRDPVPLVATIARGGGRAKARTGGVTPDAFPPAEAVARFLRACTEAGVPFKATAGLHHPLRAEYRLTYAPDSPRGTMFGFLNVFLAAAFLRHGMSEADAVRLLEECAPDAIRFSTDAVEWRGHRLDRAALAAARASGIVAFGSCSFTEPVGELQSFLSPQRRTDS